MKKFKVIVTYIVEVKDSRKIIEALELGKEPDDIKTILMETNKKGGEK